MPVIFHAAMIVVSTHSRPKAAGIGSRSDDWGVLCFNTQPPEGGWFPFLQSRGRIMVSTHSRPKAAGRSVFF